MIRSVVLLVATLLLTSLGVKAQGAPTRSVFEELSANELTLSFGAAREDSRPGFTIMPQVQDDAPSLWRHMWMGAAIGTGVGFLLGWSFDSNQSDPAGPDSFWNFESDYYYRITGSVLGLALGGGVGGIVYVVRP